MKRIFFIVCLGLAALTLNAQQNDNSPRLNLNVDIASGFVWRGITLNTSPVFQSNATFTSGNFLAGVWTSSPFFIRGDEDSFRGLDLFAFYQLSPSFSIGIINYFPHDERHYWGDTSYFNYKREETGHAFDFVATFESRGGFRAMSSVIFAGWDPNPTELVTNDEWRRNFSTYLEIGYGNTTSSGLSWELFAGGVLMESMFYGVDGAAIINLGAAASRTIEVTPTFSLPLTLRLSMNPANQSAHLTASIALFR